MSSHLQSRLASDGRESGLAARVLSSKDEFADPETLAARDQGAAAARCCAPRPIEEAISSAGGVAFEALDAHLMIARAARRVLRGRNARLGSADRRLSADRVFRERTRRGRGRAARGSAERASDELRGDEPPQRRHFRRARGVERIGLVAARADDAA